VCGKRGRERHHADRDPRRNEYAHTVCGSGDSDADLGGAEPHRDDDPNGISEQQPLVDGDADEYSVADQPGAQPHAG
jgi:hypothetical protein